MHVAFFSLSKTLRTFLSRSQSFLLPMRISSTYTIAVEADVRAFILEWKVVALDAQPYSNCLHLSLFPPHSKQKKLWSFSHTSTWKNPWERFSPFLWYFSHNGNGAWKLGFLDMGVCIKQSEVYDLLNVIFPSSLVLPAFCKNITRLTKSRSPNSIPCTIPCFSRS